MDEKKTAEIEQFVADEIVLAGERGCDSVSVKEAEEHFRDLKTKGRPDRWKYYDSILNILSDLGPKDDYPYDEPSTLDEIKAVVPKNVTMPFGNVDAGTLKDRMLGAWLGRCAGCMVGKPVEGRSKDYIRRLLDAAGAYPLDGYFPVVKDLPKGCEDYNPDEKCLKGNIDHVVRDDDIDYPIMNLNIVKTHGPEFTAGNVAEEWLQRFSYGMVYTAERAAYANFINGIMPPESAKMRNPYREWIGAQIRADLWGYISPGMPERASELAFRDASISHTGNGIYGEMYFAAAIASAFITSDIEEIITTAAGVVPERSRFAEMVHDVLRWRKEHENWEAACEALFEKYGHYHVLHTINNAAIVLLALLYGDGDFGKTVGIAVMCGEDTDCNGATAGSIMGAILGAGNMPGEWTEILNDRIESSVIGYATSRISELAEETLRIAESNTT